MPASNDGQNDGHDSTPDDSSNSNPGAPNSGFRDLATSDTLGGRISLAREAAGLSALQAARRLGVMPESWNAWERDRDAPRANRLANMAGVLGVSLSWLLSGEGEGPREAEPDQDPAQLLRDLRSTAQAVAALNQRMESIASGLEQLDDTDPDPAPKGTGTSTSTGTGTAQR